MSLFSSSQFNVESIQLNNCDDAVKLINGEQIQFT